jgi:hypothetical protein
MVVMCFGIAPAIERLASVRAEDIDLAGFSELVQRPVDGGQPDLAARSHEMLMELLRRPEVAARPQALEDGPTLARASAPRRPRLVHHDLQG